METGPAARIAIVAGIGLAGILAGDASSAEEAPNPGRFSLSASGEGFIRLDTLTGAVSHCTRTDGVWRCVPAEAVEPAAGAREAGQEPAIEARLRRLEAAVAAIPQLAAQINALGREVEGLRTSAAPGDGAAPKEDQEEVRPGAGEGFGRQVAGRFQRLVTLLRRGASGSAPD